MVELTRDGLGPFENDPAMLAAWERAQELEDKQVVDVNGATLGRVTRCFGEEGEITRCEVTLSPQARRMFDAPQPVAAFPPQWIAEVEGERLRLTKAAEDVVRPKMRPPRPTGMGGAPDLPRKIR